METARGGTLVVSASGSAALEVLFDHINSAPCVAWFEVHTLSVAQVFGADSATEVPKQEGTMEL
jgi:hypothetical protein